MNPLNNLNNVIKTIPINQLNTLNQVNPVNQVNPGNQLNPLNQVNNIVNQIGEVQSSLMNVNKNESFDELNTLKSAYKLGLVNNQKYPDQNNGFLSDKAYSIKYTPWNILDNASSYIYVENPKDVIGDCENAIVMQPTTYLQMASGCRTENEYDVILDSPQGLVYAFYFKEKSNCCCRNCCKQATRSFDMFANIVPSGKALEHKRDNHYFKIERYCGCNDYCCCCNCIRPKMFVYYEKTGEYLGKIIDSCSCCDNLLEIYDSSESLIYEIRTSYYQLGLRCGRNAETVAKIDFKVVAPETQKVIGHLIKIPSLNDKIGRAMVESHQGSHDASNSFIINFPDGASPDEKFLLIIAAIKLGYQFFTHNSCKCCNHCNSYCGNWCHFLNFPFKFMFGPFYYYLCCCYCLDC